MQMPTLEEIVKFLWVTAQETKSDTQRVSAAKASFDCLLKLKGTTNNDSEGLTVVIEGGINGDKN